MFSIQLAADNIYTQWTQLNYRGVNMKSEILKCNSYLIYGLFMIIIIAALRWYIHQPRYFFNI